MTDIIVARATAPGEGAVGIVRLSGPGCLRAAAGFLRWKKTPAPRVATLAGAVAGGSLLDRVLVTYFPGPESYTGEDLVEIGAHGSPYVLGRLLEAAVEAGARPAEPGEFTRRAFLNGRMDLAQAEAVCRLIRAGTESAHRAALAQLQGGLSRRVAGLRRGVVELLARVEAELDHPEEDLPAFDREAILRGLSALCARVADLLATHRAGRLACEGARVVLAGRPNVGKSSLLNALAGSERAIVAETPGTTRDTVEVPADLGGTAAVLVDTAGLREGARDPVERAGIERTRRALAAADLVVAVVDGSKPLRESLRGLREIANGGKTKSVIVALNKADLPSRTTINDIRPALGSASCCNTSALRGEGVEELRAAMGRALLTDAAAGEDGVVIASLRHRRALERAQESLEAVGREIGAPELAALRLREALDALGSIVGETAAEEVLDEIFSKFCVGK